MIVLPERNAPRGKVLLPQRRREWERPSQRASAFGIPNATFFTITARAHDGAIVWRGRFEDREDADAFLFAIATGSLPYERELWRLPTPHYPGLPEGLVYSFVTFNVLTTLGSNTYNVPSDFNAANNSIHGIGGGGSGGAGAGATRNSSGGGGGGYSRIEDVALTPEGTADYTVGAGGAARDAANGTQVNGNAG